MCLAWNISGLEICVRCTEYLRLLICVCHAEYLRSWGLCLSRWISQSLVSVSPFGENLRAPLLCQPWRISQSLKSVSDVQNISNSQVCVIHAEYLRISSLCLRDEYLNTMICVKRTEYLRVSSLCLAYRIAQTLCLPC